VATLAIPAVIKGGGFVTIVNRRVIGAALGALVVASAAAVAAQAGTDRAKTATATPKRGGTLTIARAFEPVSFDPLKTNGDNGTLWTIVQIYDQLVEYRPGSFTPQPALAKSWKVSSDGKTITFHLRTASFSNGTPVTAADVKNCLDRFASPKTDPGFAFLGASIKSTSITNAHTIVLKLKYPDQEILPALAVPTASIYPKASEASLGTAPVGSGPFALKQFRRGQVTDLVRNQHFWRTGRPYLDEVKLTYVPDDTTRILQVRSGQADAAEAVPFSQIAELDKSSGVSVQIAPIVSYDGIFLNQKYAPLTDQKVRQALNYALDKRRIDTAVYAGKAQIENSTIAKTQYWSKTVPAYPFDLTKAKKLMSESKYPKGFKLQLSVPAGDSLHESVAVIAKQEWAQLGINVSVTKVDQGSLFTDYSQGKYQAAIPMPLITSDVLVPDELALAWLQWTPGQQSFFTNYKNTALGADVRLANRTVNKAKRAALWRKIQVESMQDAPWVPLYFVPARTALRDNVMNFKTLESAWWDLGDVWLK
jgi:peptide/nickel transport system substrate-binding protein